MVRSGGKISRTRRGAADEPVGVENVTDPRTRLPAGSGLAAFALVLPLLAFISLSFIAPLGALLGKSAYQPQVANILPLTMKALDQWSGAGLPPEAAFAALAKELPKARAEKTLVRVGGPVNRLRGGMRSVLTRTARTLEKTSPHMAPGFVARAPKRRCGGAHGQKGAEGIVDTMSKRLEGVRPATASDSAAAAEAWRHVRACAAGSWSKTLVDIHPAWAEPGSWLALQQAGARFTMRHYLQALDLEQRPDGSIGPRPEELRIYTPLMWRTLLVSLGVTLLCLAIGYPIAYMIANSPPRRSHLLLLMVLVPFWTSLLVRTTSWIVLLQRQGVINSLLVSLGLTPDSGRLEMIYNMTGSFVAMTHVLLPFMVLPLYSVMRAIPPSYMAAAASLGASPVQAFTRVYLPQTMPGIGAGSLLVFILAIGFYITPALVGGRSGQLISGMIAYHVQTSLNWGLAAALSSILLLAVIGLYLLYSRVLGIERMSLG